MKKHIRLKFSLRIGIILSLILLFCFIVFAERTGIFQGKNMKVIEVPASAESLPAAPGTSAQTAVLIESGSGRILFEKNKDQQMYPASTTKIMTALLAVEKAESTVDPDSVHPEEDMKKELERLVTVADEAVGAEGSSIFLKKGEKIQFQDLLYGMMLRSGNDAALAVAADVGGSQEEFVAMMNEKVASLGLKNTVFKNPNGLQNEEHVSTAYDLAMIAREGMKHELFRDIAGTKSWNASREGADNYNYFYNKNKTIFQYNGATGIKIGYTMAAGRCLVASAKRNGMELIAVVLNDPDWFDDVYKMFDYGFECYDNVEVAEKEKPLTSISVKNGDSSKVKVGVKNDVVCPCIKGEKTDISITYNLEKSVKAPISRWQEAGNLEVYSAGEYIYSEPLYYLEDISEKRS